MQRGLVKSVVTFGLVALIAGALAFATGRHALQSALQGVRVAGQGDLALASDRLSSELERYRMLAVVTADQQIISSLLNGGNLNSDAAQRLTHIADRTGAFDLLIVDRNGTIVVQSGPTSSVTQAGLPEFERAMDGALGLGHRVDAATGARVFAFAAPVFSRAGPVIGALVVLVDVTMIEATWRADPVTVYFTDSDGVVFAANRSELVLRRYGGHGDAAFPELRKSQVFGHALWSLNAGRYVPETAMHLSRRLVGLELNGEVLIDTAPAWAAARWQAMAAGLGTLIAAAFILLLLERRRVMADANQRLEGRVIERTAELEDLNKVLRHEVAERLAAETALRRAQADLVQAAKLSALGRMSAAISHELNQPLMAIQSFSENGTAFLERGKLDRAKDNLGRIAELARRMARIISNLRAFARQESVPLGNVDLGAVVEAALEMAAPRAAQAGVALDWRPAPGPIMVHAGEVRLQQVVLNLVSNAIDAMAEQPTRRVALHVETSPKKVSLFVCDTGPGIAEPDRIFDPFYSTKQVGAAEGLGLGLSISYGLVQSFGGAIRGRNRPEGGAEFTVDLEPGREAA